MPKQINVYFLSIILFIIGLGLGFLVGKNIIPSLPSLEQATEKLNNNLYSSQTASIRGKITKVNGNNLTITNLNTNASGDIVVSDRVIITKPGNGKASSDKTAIETDKEVLISLEMINGKYEAVAIQYVNPPPSLPPLPSIKPATIPS